MTLRLIIFDLDDTLWAAPPVLQAAEQALQGWLAEHAPQLEEAEARVRGHRQRLLAEEPGLEHRISELRRRALQRSLLEAGYDETPAARLAEDAFQHFLAARQRVDLYPEVRPTLARLAERFTLGVLTNGNADVRRIGIDGYFRFACSAEGLGVGKPDPRAFRAALEHAGVPAEQAVHVGDHPRDDIAGALGAGLRAVWVNPQGQAWEGGQEPHAQIANLAELPALLECWQTPR